MLIPGFLGFQKIGTVEYFKDRVEATIREHLQAQGRVRAQVRAIRMPVADSLRVRQAALLFELERLYIVNGPRSRFHLVGHSAGGVDARLLLGDEPLAGADATTRARFHRAHQRVDSVVSIASPQHGTHLGDSAVARAFSQPLRRPWQTVRLLPRVLGLVPQLLPDRFVQRFVWNAALDLDGTSSFARDLLSSRALIADLRPSSMRSLNARQPRSEPRLRSVVTMVAAPGSRKPDSVFEFLYAQTRGPGGTDALAQAGVRRLQRAVEREPSLVIKSPSVRMRTIDATLNDGVVNSALQMLDPSGSELLAVVVADHIDVMGYYPRPGQMEKRGLLTSGSDFGDEQLFALYRKISDRILETIEGRSR